MATVNPKFLYGVLEVIRDGVEVTTQITILDELQLSLWVETKKASQISSPKVVMYVLCERTLIICQEFTTEMNWMTLNTYVLIMIMTLGTTIAGFFF